MKRLIIKYGFLSAALLTVFLLLVMFSASGGKNYDQQEKLIYAGVFLAFMIAFPAIRELKKNSREQQTKFVNTLGLTLAIFLFPSIIYGLIDVIYWEIINPDFNKAYYAEFEERIKMGIPQEQVEEALKALKQQQALFKNPLTHFMTIFGSVYLIGIFISIPIAALASQFWKSKIN